MKPIIALNGEDIAAFHLTPLEGTIAAILKPPPYKKIVTNDNSYINGTMAICTPSSRRIDKQDITLSFFLHSCSMTDLQRRLQQLEQALINGAKDTDGNYSGVNTLTLHEYKVADAYGKESSLCLRLIYVGMSKCNTWFPYGKAVVTLKFTEPNPNNRAL